MSGAGTLLLAAVLAVAAISKWRAPDAFRAVLAALGAPRAAARVVPFAELLLAGLLLSGAAPRVAAFAALGLLVIFSAALVRLRRLHDDPLGCGCFGVHEADASPGAGLARNGLLAAVALAVAIAPSVEAPLDGGAAALAGRLSLVIGAACLWALLRALAATRAEPAR